MTKRFDSVVGIDFSKAFIDACNTIKGQGTMKYSMVREGELCDEFVAQVDSELVSIVKLVSKCGPFIKMLFEEKL